MPVWKVAVRAPYGTSFGSVAASPPATPLTVPIKPPKAIAERGLSRPMNERRANHDEHRLEHTRGDGQRDDRGVRSERGSGDGTDDVGDRAGADGGDADRIGVSKGQGDGGPDDERQDRAQR